MWLWKVIKNNNDNDDDDVKIPLHKHTNNFTLLSNVFYTYTGAGKEIFVEKKKKSEKLTQFTICQHLWLVRKEKKRKDIFFCCLVICVSFIFDDDDNGNGDGDDNDKSIIFLQSEFFFQ